MPIYNQVALTLDYTAIETYFGAGLFVFGFVYLLNRCWLMFKNFTSF